jgi:hypothetical protein
LVEISLQRDEYSKSYAGKQVSYFPHFFVVQQIVQVFLAFTHKNISMPYELNVIIKWFVNFANSFYLAKIHDVIFL